MGNLNFLKSIALEELMQIKGIGKVKAIQLKAVCELAVRMSKPSNYKKIQVKSTEDLANLVMEELRFEKREYVKLFLLNNKNEILKSMDAAVGGANFANVNMKEIIGEALKIKAPKMILVHNHPTGDPTPSRLDISESWLISLAEYSKNKEGKFVVINAIEEKLPAKMFDIELMDHIVIGDMKFRSVFAEIKQMAEKIRKQG